MIQRTLIQFFHWYTPAGGTHWDEVAERAASLAEMGVTDVWLPPSCKGASGGHSIGYDTYDLFDLGEFDQKGSVATKYGDRAALEAATGALRQAGLRVIHDAVFNHKTGADETERVHVRRADPFDRTQIEEESFEASVWTRYTFPGRGGQHSQFIWDHKCFNGVDHIDDPSEDGVFRLVNEYGDGEWNSDVDAENGNFDYLMGSNVEFRNFAVYEELKYWGRWMAEQLPTDGFRIDAAKHIPGWFLRDWAGHMRDAVNPDLFIVAEYWHGHLPTLQDHIALTDRQYCLFDAPLHFRFFDAAKAHADFDLRTIFDGTLVAADPELAVTIVSNHDTQPLQAMESAVEPWFKPLAYALILLRADGVPCVFYPDLYGAKYCDTGGDGQEHEVEMPKIACLPALIAARAKYAHGEQVDLFDDPNCIAFMRQGTAEYPGCIVLLSNVGEAWKEIDLGPDHAGAAFRDVLGHCEEEIRADDNGRAKFRVWGESVSVWVRSDSL